MTPELIRAYEQVLGDTLKRRKLLLGGLGVLAASSPDDAAASIAYEISNTSSGLLTQVQTSHATDRSIALLVARDTPSVASLTKWSRSGNSVLRVNATGILAKIGSPVLDNEVVGVLRANGDVRERYMTAVLSRVLTLSWDEAHNVAAGRDGVGDAGTLRTLIGELSNPYDSGARWCSTVMLYRSRATDPSTVTTALVEALKTEPARENLRAIGSALAGVDPVTI